MSELICLCIFLIVSTVFAIAMIVTGFLFQYKKHSKIKNSTYECGMKPFENSKIKFNIKYFNYAILFLVFDIETIFLYPIAVCYNLVNIYVIMEIFIFIMIMLWGLVFAIKKDILRWI